MRVLITGAAGQVGRALAAELAHAAELVLATRRELDLSRAEAISGRLDYFKPDLIVNAAAYTAVDKAEAEPELAFAVNATAVEAIGQWAARESVPVIHFSTDYVFDGRASEPYEETHPLNPLSVYGKSKAEGERLLLASGAPCLIVRTAWVYSAVGHNFLKTIVRLAREKHELSIVSDQLGAPTSAGQIAQFIHMMVMDHGASLPPLFTRSSSIVHFTAAGAATWHGFATAIVAGMRERGVDVKASAIRAISSAEYPAAAARPHFSRLSLERLERVFDFRPASWEDAMSVVLNTMFDCNSGDTASKYTLR